MRRKPNRKPSINNSLAAVTLSLIHISLPQILKPLIIVVGIIAIGSFFVVNNLVPYAKKAKTVSV